MNKSPKTAQDALALWDAGEPVPAFRVEAEDSEQEAIYAVAFELIRREEANLPVAITRLQPDELTTLLEQTKGHKLSVREFHVAHSIAFVAFKNGWAAMLRQHIGEHIPAITVTNPRPKEKQNGTAPTHA